jgi:adenine-specific DNA-methyltransferase
VTDLLVTATVSETTENLRPLGSRGSRGDVAATSASDLAPTATAVLAAIPAWWMAQAEAAGLEGRWLEVDQALEAQSPVELGPNPPPSASWNSLAPEQVGAAYVEALTPAARARHGRHYTPCELASHLWAQTRRALGFSPRSQSLNGLVRDPACGAGALLLPPLREHLHASYDVDPALALAGLPSVIEGVDTDPAAVWVANVVMAAEMLPTLARMPDSIRKPLPCLAWVGDGLAGFERQAAAVIMNPPYGRVRLSSGERARFAHLVYGHANLYGLFMGTAVEMLEKHGVLAALVPTSFTSGKYFANLRAYLGRTAGMSAVTFVEDRSGVFTSVLQETCLAVFEKRRRRKTCITSLGSRKQSIASVHLQRSAQPWVLPRQSDDAPVAAAASAMSETLASLGWIASTGPLVWNRRADDLSANWGANRSHVIWAADLDGGELHRDPARDGMRYLSLSMPSDFTVMLLTRTAVLVQRTTAPEQNRRLVAAHLNHELLSARDGRVTVENHVNVLRPTQGAVLSEAALTRVLSTRTMDRVVRTISGSVALSAYELQSIPMPDPLTVAAWEDLDRNDLEAAVAVAYTLSAP